MAKGDIENIELKISGSNWNEVTLSEYKQGRRIEHKYYSIKKKLVMKLLNASSAPSISDFEGWLRDEEAKDKKADNGKTTACERLGSDWWDSRD